MTKYDLIVIASILSVLGFFSFTIKIQSWHQLHRTNIDRFWLVFWGGPIVWIVALWFWVVGKFE